MLNENGGVTSVVEKPRIPKSNLALVGLYLVKEVSVLVEKLKSLVEAPLRTNRSEFHLTDALMDMVDSGVLIKTHMVDNWFDCGQRDTLLYTNRLLMERRPSQPEYSFPNTVILPPVYISDSCNIENSIIGPNVAIADNAQIKNSIVRNAILGAYSQLESIVLDQSVIGNDAALKGKSHSVNIGDNTEIDFNA